MGVIMGKLKQSQRELVQSEKNAALGSLLAGLAHEINNPMTFIYSSMEPLKEMLGFHSKQDAWRTQAGRM
jgi:C4-dicarboxylate-specific signal transduction histidine kinase